MPRPPQYPRASRKADSDRRYKWELVYEDLRCRIGARQLPPGAFLESKVIAGMLGVSRAPVRVALAMLAEEGLVDVLHHGSYVAPVRSADVRESALIHVAFCVEAARRASELADPALAARLMENVAAQELALQSGDLVRCASLAESLHVAILVAVAGPRARRHWAAARTILARAGKLARGDPARAVTDRRRLVEAIATGGPALAAAAMRVHLMRNGP